MKLLLLCQGIKQARVIRRLAVAVNPRHGTFSCPNPSPPAQISRLALPAYKKTTMPGTREGVLYLKQKRHKASFSYASVKWLKNKNTSGYDSSTGRGRRITDEEISELINKLQSLLPESRRRIAGRANASKLLKETCSYIKSLHREVDDLSDRLSSLMATMDSSSPQAEIIRSLLRS